MRPTTLHVGKTNFTIFHASAREHCCQDNFIFDGTAIHMVSNTNYLGLCIDNTLSWKHHVSDLCNSLTKFIGIFYHTGRIFSLETAIQVYYSFVYPRISYGIEIYGTAPASTLRPLQVMQNRLLKLLTRKPRRYPTNQLYVEYDLLKVSDIHTYCMYGIIFRYRNGSLPSALANIIRPPLSNPENCMTTRNNNLFYTTHHRNIHGKMVLNNYCSTLWQKLPNYIKDKRSLRSFQKCLKTYLISCYNS